MSPAAVPVRWARWSTSAPTVLVALACRAARRLSPALQAQGLSSGGIALTYSVAGNVLTASAGGETIFTLQVGGDGSFNFTLVEQLDHPTPDGNDDELLELPIDFSGVLTAVDGDGDSVGTFNGGSFVIDVEDDVPQWRWPRRERGTVLPAGDRPGSRGCIEHRRRRAA